MADCASSLVAASAAWLLLRGHRDVALVDASGAAGMDRARLAAWLKVVRMSSISFVVHGLPKPAGSKRAFQHKTTGRIVVTDANKNSREWKNLVADAAFQARPYSMDGLLDGPLLLSLIFMLPRPKGHMGAKGLRPSAPRFPAVKPDLLKLARAVEDALCGIVYRDDSQIVSESLQKAYGEPARVHVRIEQLTNTDGWTRRDGSTSRNAASPSFACVVDESAGQAEETP